MEYFGQILSLSVKVMLRKECEWYGLFTLFFAFDSFSKIPVDEKHYANYISTNYISTNYMTDYSQV